MQTSGQTPAHQSAHCGLIGGSLPSEHCQTEERSILRKNRKANCLRDLYMEDINQAKVLRDSDIIPENEKVLPFSGNNYLTYSTKHQDVSLSCPQIHNEIKHIHE